MKKLTAGIFAGILTIVTVNAADAAIATSGYVTEKVGAVDAKVGTLNDLTTSAKGSTVAAINEVVGNVKTNTTDISGLKTAVENLGGGESGSVAQQIATELGKIDVTKPADAKGVATSVTQDNGTISVTYAQIADADVADNAAIKQSKIDGLTGALDAKLNATTAASTYETIANVDTIKAKIPEAASATNKLVDTTAMNNALSAKADQNIIGDGFTSTNTVAKAIEDAKLAAGTDVTDKLGGTFSKDSTVQDALNLKADKTQLGGNFTAENTVAKAIADITTENTGTIDTRIKTATDAINTELADKQDKLDGTNVKVAEGSTGNAVTAVTAENGTVTVTLGKSFIEEKTTIGAAGHYVLTADVSDTGVANYQWEKIDRATTEQ